MDMSFFGPYKEIVGGLGIGAVLGFTLAKSALKNQTTLKKQFLLKDFTALKIILTSLATASSGFFLLSLFKEPSSHTINTASLWSSFFGAGLMGLGLFILGFCPGTCLVACASGSKKAYYGFTGMVFGSLIYAKNASWIQNTFKPSSSITKQTLMESFSVPHLVFVAIYLLAAFLLFKNDQSKEKAMS